MHTHNKEPAPHYSQGAMLEGFPLSVWNVYSYLIKGHVAGEKHTIITYVQVDAGCIKVWKIGKLEK